MGKYIGLGVETTFGTAASSIDYFEGPTRSTLHPVAEVLTEPYLGGRGSLYWAPGKMRVEGDIEAIVNWKVLDKFFHAILGKRNFDGENTEWTPEPNPSAFPSWTVVIGQDDQEWRAVGMIATKMELNFAAGEIGKATLSLLGAKVDNRSSINTPTIKTDNPIGFHEVVVKKGGSVLGYAKRVRLTFDNHFDEDWYMLGSRYFGKATEKPIPGNLEVGGEIELVKVDWNIWDEATQESTSESSLMICLDGSDCTEYIDCGNIVITSIDSELPSTSPSTLRFEFKSKGFNKVLYPGEITW